MLSEMTDIALERETLPQAPVRTMEGVAIILEQIQDDVLARLGGLSLQGASSQEQVWIDQVSDMAERIQAMTDLVFKAVNEVGAPAEPTLQPAGLHLVPAQHEAVEPEVVESTPETTKIFDTHTIHELLTFSLRNPSFRAEELKKSGNGFAQLDPKRFKTVRADMIAYLATHGVTAAWEVTGKTRGQRYDLTVTEGHEVIAQLLLNNQLNDEAAETEIEDEDIVVETVTIPPAEMPFEMKDEVSIAEILSRGAPLRVNQLVFEKFGVHSVPQNVFHDLHAEIRAAVSAGLIKRLSNGRYAEASFVEVTQTAADVEKMLKDLRRETGIQTVVRKPRNRGRGNRRG